MSIKPCNPVFIMMAWVTMLAACNETKEIEAIDLGYDYYPLELGRYWIYEVDEIQYLLAGFDTTHYQLKETLFDSIVAPDQVMYLIRREKRPNETAPWQKDSVWTVAETPNYYAFSENNVPYIKLTFPIAVGNSWDGNSLNTNAPASFFYAQADSAVIDSIGIENHIKVVLSDVPQNVATQDEKVEIYARNVGLVQKHYLTLRFCTVEALCELRSVQSGRFLYQKLIETGNE